jgi:PAS domain S-box-containing protein
MALDRDRLQALRQCCRDDEAFIQLQQILGILPAEQPASAIMMAAGESVTASDPGDSSLHPGVQDSEGHHGNGNYNDSNYSDGNYRDAYKEAIALERLVTTLPRSSARASAASPNLLRGVAEAISQLLIYADYTKGIDTALATLGRATDVDRVYLFAMHPHPDTGELVASQRFEWVQEGIMPQLDNPQLQNCAPETATIDTWYQTLQTGQTVSALTREVPMPDRHLLEEQDILSVLLVPIFVRDGLWGFVGFDDCHSERSWTADEETVLILMANSLGGAIARHQAEIALQDSEARLQRITANVPGMIFQFRRDVEGHCQVAYASSGAAELLELSPEQMQPDDCPLAPLCHPDDYPAFQTMLEKAFQTHQPWNWEGRIITPSGKLKWVQGMSRPMLQPNGDVVWDGVLVDISDRKQIETQHRQSEARYRAMLDASPDLMFRVGENGQYLDFKGNHLAHIPREEIVGNYLHDMLPPEVADLSLHTVRLALATGELQTCEYQLTTPLGLRDYEARVVTSGPHEALAIVQDVTHRKQAEAAIRQSEARNRALVNAIPDLMFRIRRDGTYLDCKADSNDAVLLPPEELIGKTVYDVLPPELAQQRMDYVTRALETGTMQRFEYQLQLNARSRASQLYRQISPGLDEVRDQSLRDYEARIVVSGDDEVLAIVRDITDRKLSEEALRRSEAKFSRAFHASPNPLTISTLQDGRFIEVNDKFLEVTGYCLEEVVGHTVGELQLWNDPANRAEVIRLLQEEGRVRTRESHFRVKSGEIRTGLFSAEIIEIGNEPCMLGMVVDITDRIRADQQLQAAAERDRILRDIALRIRESLNLQQILDTTVTEVRHFLQADRAYIAHEQPDGTVVATAESVAEGYPSILGRMFQDQDLLDALVAMFTEDQVRSLHDIHQETQHPKILDYFQEYQIQAGMAAPIMVDHQLYGVLVVNQCSHTREWQPYEVELLKQLAPQVAIALQQAQLYNQVQALNAGLEQQVAERTAELQQKMEELQELNQLKDEFLNAFSHDLRTPTMGISLVVSNLLNQPQDPIPISRTILERMVQSSNHQLQLINSLLQAHSAETRGVILNYELVDLGELVQAIVEEVDPLVKKNQAKLDTALPPDLPTVKADALQLRRVFENLITNALNHNPPGVHITLGASIETDVICLTLQDDGVGMPPEIRDHLFERYTRGRNNRHSTGIGLGLYLCQQIITAHGGQIGVDSHPGDGATFWLTLPLAIPAMPSSQSAIAP